ncbi:MAG TPA: DUF6737 family protein [Coleofasciculaceae cyanobacterium]
MSAQKPLSPWSYKPWWCQPWSILLTGTIVIAGSWILVKTIWLTILVSLPIVIWWTFFLLIWPMLVRQSGSLDNYYQSSQDFIPQERD